MGVRPASQLSFLFGPAPRLSVPERAPASPPPRPARPAHAPEPPLRRRSEDARVSRLEGELATLVGERTVLRIHQNRSTMISFRRSPSGLLLRAHAIFLDAPPPVVKAIADYAARRSRLAGKALDAFIKDRRPAEVAPSPRREQALRTRGEVHDLQEIFDNLNRTYFAGSVDAKIGWGRGTTKRRRRTIRMGAYFHETKTIVIHPALDRPEVPPYFVGLVVYHEMLHQAVPGTRDTDGRRCVHGPEFRARERLFLDYDRGMAWERQHIGKLLRPLPPSPARSHAGLP